MAPRIANLTDLTEVGRGGFGTVFRASDPRFGRSVAVKVIRDAALERDVKARFERESLALGHLSGHPNIVALHDSGTTEDGDLYLLMEYLGGGSLSERLTRSGPADPALVADWGAALAGALETAHRAGIVHRDVKPENVLFSDYDVPKLVDFGIARMRSAYETRTGFVSATLNHAAPEVVAGSPVAASSDVYSLASVLYTMLAGRAPFDRGSESSLAPMIARIATAPPPDLRPSGVPDALAEVIECGLSKDISARYDSASAFGDALAAVAHELGRPGAAVPLGASHQLAEAKAELALTPSPDPAHQPVPNETVDVPRNRAATYEPPAAGAPTVRPWYRRPAGIAAVTALAVAFAGGGVAWAVMTGSNDESPPGAKRANSSILAASMPVPATSPTSYRAAGVAQDRKFSTDGKRVNYTVALTNTSPKKVTRYWVEVIPKELAASVDDITFTPSAPRVIDPDPVVYWQLALGPGDRVKIGWSTKVPKGGSTGEKLLAQVQKWQSGETTKRQPQVTRFMKKLQATEKKKNPGGLPATAAGSPIIGSSSGGTVLGQSDPPATSNFVSGNTSSNPPANRPRSGGTQSRPAANRAPRISVGSTTSGEQGSVSVRLSASDPDGGAPTVRLVSGPAWLRVSGSSVSGSVPWSAASGRRSSRYAFKVQATDGKESAYASGSITVNDTHFKMPNLRNQWQDDVLATLGARRDHRGCTTNSMETSRIWTTQPGGGSIVAVGSTVVVWYANGQDPVRACSGL